MVAEVLAIGAAVVLVKSYLESLDKPKNVVSDKSPAPPNAWPGYPNSELQGAYQLLLVDKNPDGSSPFVGDYGGIYSDLLDLGFLYEARVVREIGKQRRIPGAW